MAVKWVDGDNETRVMSTREVDTLFKKATDKKPIRRRQTKQNDSQVDSAEHP